MIYQKGSNLFNVAIYIRLSREDGDKEESDSVGNQRKLLTEYVNKHDDFILYDVYIDDGFTGTNFNRPDFHRMIADIEDNKVNCVVVKDLSRFGRDYIDTGRYLERIFPELNVRFISVTDNIDSMKQAYDMLLPIKNIFNEQYARDISNKVQATVKSKQKAGEFIGAFTSYGYKKSPANKNKLVIDEYASEVVKRVFTMYAQGIGKQSIAKILNAEGILCPSEYKKLNGENYKNCNRLEKTSYWTYSTIKVMLQNEIYIGNMVQGKKHQRMRSKQRLVEKENWIRVENTHEPIIDRQLWDKVQKLLTKKHRDIDLETNKNIFERIGDILSYINPFSENFFGKKLVELILDGLKGLFVPEDGFFDTYFTDLKNWFSDRLGFLWTPFDIIIDILNKILNINFSEPIFHIPEIDEPFSGSKLISEYEYNLNSLLENDTFKNIHDIYFVCVDAVIIFALINLARKKIEEVFSN